MNELSIFIDESGCFGPYEHHSPFYLITLVFHQQSVDITKNINHLNNKLRSCEMPDCTVHAGPLIRREDEYRQLPLLKRKQIFNFLYNFVRTTDITYRSIIVEKKHLIEDLDLVIQLTKQLSGFLRDNLSALLAYDRVVVYYDYGQRELTHILASVFSAALHNVEFKKVSPANYKLFQAADMLCTLELLTLKAERKIMSNSELTFFTSAKNLHKAYLRAIQKKRF